MTDEDRHVKGVCEMEIAFSKANPVRWLSHLALTFDPLSGIAFGRKLPIRCRRGVTMKFEVARPWFEGASPRDLNLHHFSIQRALTRCALVGENLYRKPEDDDFEENGGVVEIASGVEPLTVRGIHGKLPETNDHFVKLFYEFEEIDGRHAISEFSPPGRTRELNGVLRLSKGRIVFLPCRYHLEISRNFERIHTPMPDGTVLEMAIPADRLGVLALLFASREHGGLRRQVEAFLKPELHLEFRGLSGRFVLRELDGGWCVTACDLFGLEALHWALEARVDEALEALDGYPVERCRAVARKADEVLVELGDMRKMTKKAILEKIEAFRSVVEARPSAG